jgi:isovaleryl-CoA dehydrogenase
MPGFSVGQQLKGKLGMRASNTAELVLQNVKVPAANLIGMLCVLCILITISQC